MARSTISLHGAVVALAFIALILACIELCTCEQWITKGSTDRLTPIATPVSALSPLALNLTVLAIFSNSGPFHFADYETLLTLWRTRLARKYAIDNSWPFVVNLIEADIQSSLDKMKLVTDKYLNPTYLAQNPIHIVIGPEHELCDILAPITAQYGIPMISGASSTNHQLDDQGNRRYNTSFFIRPAPSGLTLALIRELSQQTDPVIQTMAWISAPNSHDLDGCTGTADLLASKGIQTIATYTLSTNRPHPSEWRETVRAMKLLDPQPQFVLICWYSPCDSKEVRAYSGDSMQYFEELQYQPEQIALTDCFSFINTLPRAERMKFRYVLGPSIVSAALGGTEFIDESTPYADEFRPQTQAVAAPGFDGRFNNLRSRTYTKAEFAQNRLDGGPGDAQTPGGDYRLALSSNQGFRAWYLAKVGVAPSATTVATWAAICAIETIFYKASEFATQLWNKSAAIHDATGLTITKRRLQSLPPEFITAQLDDSQIPSVYGRVILDTSGVNFNARVLVLQITDAAASPFQIVAPSELAQAPRVKVAPQWNERLYVRQPFGSNSHEIGQLILLLLQSLFLAAICVTAIKHRAVPEIRMLHWAHICLMCVCVFLASVAMSTIWVADTTTAQCNLYQWMLYPPLSMLISLNNLKEYRLSKFMTNVRLRNLVFTHNKVLFFAALWPIGTAIALLITEQVGHMTAQPVLVDIVRPSLDYHVCQTGTTWGLNVLIVGFVLHVLASIRCIWLVRNGVEGFRDGTTLKESFMLLYMLFIIVFVIQIMLRGNINALDAQAQAHATLMSPSALYTLRSTMVQLSMTLFLLRVLASRLATLWLSAEALEMLNKMSHLIAAVTKSSASMTTFHQSNAGSVMSTLDAASVPHGAAAPGTQSFRRTKSSAKYAKQGNASFAASHIEDMINDSPVYAAKAVDKQSIDEMWHMLAADPSRLAAFIAFSQTLHSEDGVLFCLSTVQFKTV